MREVRAGRLSRGWSIVPAEWVGYFDFDGHGAPWHYPRTREVPGSRFSVGVFQWVRTADGKHVKRGPVLVRISGPVTEEEEVVRMAAQVCFQLEAGTYAGRRSVAVRERGAK